MKNEENSPEKVNRKNLGRNKRRQSIKILFNTFSPENQKLSKIIGSDVRHGTEMGEMTEKWQDYGLSI